MIPCIEGRVENAGALAQASVYGSILPAAWSFMLALRARGLGTAWTTLHIMFEQDAAKLLGIPEHVTQTALFPVAHYTGSDFKPAKRIPSAQLVHWDTLGTRRRAERERPPRAAAPTIRTWRWSPSTAPRRRTRSTRRRLRGLADGVAAHRRRRRTSAAPCSPARASASSAPAWT